VIEAGLFNLLSTAPAITAVCGTRIYPVVMPTGPAYPAMCYRTIVAPQHPTMNGTGMQHWRIQFDCWAETALGAAAVRAALLKTLIVEEQFLLSDGTLLQSATLHNVSDDFMSASRVYNYMADVTLDFNFQT
jgi:hypothetical protein